MDLIGTLTGGTVTLVSGYLIPFLIVLTIVVFVHEMGHFLVGRWCGIGVQAFSIGFGPEIVGFNDRKGTRWKLSAVPLGGYVKFAGDANGASLPDQETLDGMSAAEKAVSFHHQSVAKRAAVVAAGPIANFLLAILVFAGLTYVKGRYVLTPRVESVHVGSAAEKAGFLKGDIVRSIDGKAIQSFSDLQRNVSGRAEEKLSILVERAGKDITLEAVPILKENKTPFGVQRIGLLGLQASTDPDDLKHVSYGLSDSLSYGVTESWYVVDRTFAYLNKLVSGRESTDQLSGPIRIAQISGQVADKGGIEGLIGLIAVLSVSIGLINLFPVPMLDGGHLLFFAVEALRGRPLSERMQELGFKIGFGLVALLMLFTTWNDILHIGSTFLGRGT